MGSPCSVSSIQQISLGLEDTWTQVCTSCMGRRPLHTLQRCAMNVRKQEIKPHSFLDCFRLVVQSHLWWQVRPIFVHTFWQGQGHPCITLVVMESLCLSGSNLVLGMLLRQLRVRRKSPKALEAFICRGLPAPTLYHHARSRPVHR